MDGSDNARQFVGREGMEADPKREPSPAFGDALDQFDA
jgi:hypothetical protein